MSQSEQEKNTKPFQQFPPNDLESYIKGYCKVATGTDCDILVLDYSTSIVHRGIKEFLKHFKSGDAYPSSFVLLIKREGVFHAAVSFGKINTDRRIGYKIFNISVPSWFYSTDNFLPSVVLSMCNNLNADIIVMEKSLSLAQSMPKDQVISTERVRPEGPAIVLI